MYNFHDAAHAVATPKAMPSTTLQFGFDAVDALNFHDSASAVATPKASLSTTLQFDFDAEVEADSEDCSQLD